MVAVGVDACKTGWIAVSLRDGRAEARYMPSIHAAERVFPEATGIGIDIPIGLPEQGRRDADRAARAFLRARQQSVFWTPARAVLEAPTHREANELAVSLTGVGISQQSYALAQRILEVDAWLASAPCQVWEVHPEVSFAVVLGHPATASKKTWTGMTQRREAPQRADIDLDHCDEEAGSKAMVDDMLDAGAAAWTTQRLFDGTARSFPDPPLVGPEGRAVAIWA